MRGFALKQASGCRIKVLCVNLQIHKRNNILLDGVLSRQYSEMPPFSLLSRLPKPAVLTLFLLNCTQHAVKCDYF